jgi:hypothetical protein
MMTGPSRQLSLRRHEITLRFGLLAGLVLGPSVGLGLTCLPSSEWLGPIDKYSGGLDVMMVGTAGLVIGPIAGLSFASIARWIQRSRRECFCGPDLEFDAPAPASDIEPGRLPTAELHVPRRTDTYPGT